MVGGFGNGFNGGDGQILLLASLVAPTVTSPTSTAVTQSSATLGGNVTADGGASISVRGVVLSPTATNNNPLIGGIGVVNLTTTGTTGVFTLNAASLTSNTAYSFKAYATNSVGTGYSSIGTFTTLTPSLTINNVTANEGNGGTTNFTFTVSLSAPAGPGGVSFDIATANGTAIAGSDYVANTLTSQTIPAASSTYSFTVSVNGDTLNEVAETFVVNVTNVTGANVGDSQGLGTITNDDALPSLSINDVSVTEGNSGTTNAVFAVTLNTASGQTVQVNYATANNTATQPADYASNSGTLTFAPGQTSQPITVLVVADTDTESNETYFVNLSGASNATISDNQGLGTIIDDDLPTPPTITDIADQTVNEDVATSALAFTVDDAQTPAGSLVVTGSSSNVTLVPNTNIVFSGSGAARTVTVTPAANLSGSSTITLTVTDGGGLTATDTFLLTVNPLNDLPSFVAGPNQSLPAGTSSAQTVPSWATAINDGDPDFTQSLSFNVSNTNNGLFSVQPSVAANGTLSYTPNGSAGSATVSVSLTDDATAGGTALTTAIQSFTITIAANTAPTISDVADPTFDEDLATSALAFTVGDAETAVASLTVSGSSSNLSLVPDANIMFGGSGSSRTVTVTPTPNLSGSSTITLTVTDSGGLTATDTFLLTVNPLNDLPSFVAGPNQSLPAGTSSAQTVPSWATAINDGDPDFTQSLSFNVSNTNNGLFSVQPSVAANGTLSYTPNGSAGSATVSVSLTDDATAGGTALTTAIQTFSITIAANIAPTISDVADPTIDEDLATSALAFTVGDAETAVTSLTVSGNSSNLSLVPNANIVFGGSGSSRTVTVTPTSDLSGSSTITLTVTDSGGLTATDTFLLTVNPINDLPSCVAGPNQTLPSGTSSAQTVPSWATAISDGDPDFTQSLSFNVSNTNNGLFSVQPSVAANGTLSYTPNGTSGSATVSVSLTDDATAGGKALTSAIQTFTITIASGGTDPVIVASTIGRAQGSANYRSVIANVADAGGAGNVTVTAAAATGSGVVISGIQNNNGVISALIRAGCLATNATFTLTANNGSTSNVATLPVTVTPGNNPNWCAWWPR